MSFSSEPNPKQSRIITTVLSPAVGLWLRSQVEHVEALQVKIESGDRQILSGNIQRVFASADRAIYQGLHLSHIQVAGENIRLNLGQVLKGKPVQLLEPIFIETELSLQESDLNASLQAPLLAQAVTDLVATLLTTGLGDMQDELPLSSQSINLTNLQILVGVDQLTLSAGLISTSGTTTPFVIRTGLRLASGHELQFEHPQWLTSLTAKRGLPLKDLDGFKLDLGSDVEIQTLSLVQGQLSCRGRIKV
ncbi:MAG: DUF2993 domain-containing protein, partial [Leptolyngbyaceae bacterium]|nr:DUF2993 domain-containing protein [Leptolyngbyaceae bacterium]